MSRVHILNVGAGDCAIIEHNSGRITIIDICGGNRFMSKTARQITDMIESPKGNFAMCKNTTNPIEYLSALNVNSIFRFILTHPDMDHLDGFENLTDNFSIQNFWDSKARKDKPDFEGSPYKEEDWDEYIRYRDGKINGVTVVTPHAGSKFCFANQEAQKGKGHDGLHICSPNHELINDANESQEFNDASYILTYWSSGGKIVFPGDSQEKSWELATKHYGEYVNECSFLLAPHHGRKSGTYDFLDIVKPKLTLLGCAPSENLAYDSWRNRNLQYFTQNQAGNTILECGDDIQVFVENENYAQTAGGDVNRTNYMGYYYLTTI